MNATITKKSKVLWLTSLLGFYKPSLNPFFVAFAAQIVDTHISAPGTVELQQKHTLGTTLEHAAVFAQSKILLRQTAFVATTVVRIHFPNRKQGARVPPPERAWTRSAPSRDLFQVSQPEWALAVETNRGHALETNDTNRGGCV